jgi:hypothetical protein
MSWYVAPACITTELRYRHLRQELSNRRSRWPCGLRRRSSAARLLGSRVSNPFRLFCLLCVVKLAALRRADCSLWGILPSMCLFVCVLETATKTWLGPIGLLRHRVCYFHHCTLLRCGTICPFRGYSKELCPAQPVTRFYKVLSNLFFM